MTFEQLRCLIAAAEEETFFAAAERLNMTQPALSKQIIRLERELGMPLFDRTRRRAALSEAGQLFYRDALALVRRQQEALDRLERCRLARRAAVRVGTLPLLAQHRLLPLFREFERQHPEIPFTIEEVEEAALLAGLEAGGYDLVLARQNMAEDGRYLCQTLSGDELVAALPEHHPLSERDAVRPEELAEEKLILMHRNTSVYRLCVRLLPEKEGRRPMLRNARIESILSAVAAGEGVSLLMRSSFTVFSSPGVVIRPLQPRVSLPVVLVRRPGGEREESARTLAGFLCQAAAERCGGQETVLDYSQLL